MCGGRVLERSRDGKKSTERTVGGRVVRIFQFDHFFPCFPSPLSMMITGRVYYLQDMLEVNRS